MDIQKCQTKEPGKRLLYIFPIQQFYNMRTFLLFLLCLSPVLRMAGQPPVEVTVSGIEKPTGTLRISVYREEAGFPTDAEKAWRHYTQPVNSQSVSFLIDDLPPGEYAIAIHHDENNDGEVNTKWYGLPKEGLGVSKNAKGFMGPPDFEDAVFRLGEDGEVLKITLVYL